MIKINNIWDKINYLSFPNFNGTADVELVCIGKFWETSLTAANVRIHKFSNTYNTLITTVQSVSGEILVFPDVFNDHEVFDKYSVLEYG